VFRFARERGREQRSARSLQSLRSVARELNRGGRRRDEEKIERDEEETERNLVNPYRIGFVTEKEVSEWKWI
jgi:hypothetical protein